MPIARPEEREILIRRAAIEKRVREVAHRITRDLKGQRVHLIGVLKGACIFLSDLVREIGRGHNRGRRTVAEEFQCGGIGTITGDEHQNQIGRAHV